jgi:hypothetical protein
MADDLLNDLLERGVTALKEERKAEARGLLEQVLAQDERNETAWLWMSGVVDTDTERRICLENVLAINPNNGIAKRGLERLGISQRMTPFTTARPPGPGVEEAATPSERTIQPLARMGEPDAPDEAKRKEQEKEEEKGEEKKKERKPASPPRRATGRRPGLILGVGAGLLIVVCVSVVGIWWAIDNGWLPLGTMPTPLATVDIKQTLTAASANMTPTLSPTSPPTWTPSPTSVPSTPAPTQTPLPTNTPRLTWTPSLTPTVTLTGTLAATPTPVLTLPPTWTPQPTNTPAPGLTFPPTWTPPPTSTPAPGLTLLPTWTLRPTRTPSVTPTLTLTGTLVTVTPGG